jgi:integrase
LLFDKGFVVVLPFSVFARAGRPYFYVAFKNENTGRYLPAISTKKEIKEDAILQAWVWYREGIPHKDGALDIKTRALRDTIRHAAVSMQDAEFIIGELRRRGLVKSCVFAGSPDSVPFHEYLEEFWDWDRSPYIQEKLRREHSIHRNYVKQMLRTVRRFWLPFFPAALLGELLPRDIDRFVEYLASLPLGNARKNDIIKAGAVPLRWAYRKEKTGQDVTRGIVVFSMRPRERKILSLETASALFKLDWKDERARVANMTAMVTGLRAGELQGLRVGDLGEGCLLVRHSWNRVDKLKSTKNNEARIVELPFPSVLQALRHVASLNPHGAGPDSFVFWAERSADKPVEQIRFVSGLQDALRLVGVDWAVAKTYSFHAWRHFFTSYMRDKIEDKLLQSQTGHKTFAMLERYSAHQRSGDRDKIRGAQLNVFSALLPKD